MGRPGNLAVAGMSRCARTFHTSRSRHSYEDTIPFLGVKLDARVVVTGFTGKAVVHTKIAMEKLGTNVVGGVSPNKGGTMHLGKPVFATLQEAVRELQPDVVSVFVPPLLAADAILDAVNCKVPLIVSIAEGIPVHQQMRVHQTLRKQSQSRLLGGNCPGMINTRGCKLGIQPLHVHTPGRIGVAGRSGTLTYEAANATSEAGLGQTYVFGIGGDPYPGTTTLDALKYLLSDPETEGIFLIGEIGGEMEQDVAAWLTAHPEKAKLKPISGMVVGKAAPRLRTMGHAGAIWEFEHDTAEYKRQLWREAGIVVFETPAEVARHFVDVLR